VEGSGVGIGVTRKGLEGSGRVWKGLEGSGVGIGVVRKGLV